MFTLLAIYLLLGCFAGLIAGLFGVGGGLVVVPALLAILHWQGIAAGVLTHIAVGTSLACMVITSLSSVWAHHQRGAVDWRIVGQLAPGIILGSVLGGITAGHLSGPHLQLAFGCFVLLVAAQMGFGLSASPQRSLPGRPGLSVAGTVIGWVSALFGIGGGTLSVPFLAWCNVVMQRAVGISAACGIPIALFGSLTYIWQGWGAAGLPQWSSGFVYWPAFFGIVITSTLAARLGASLAHRLPAAILKRVMAVFLIFVGIKLISGS